MPDATEPGAAAPEGWSTGRAVAAVGAVALVGVLVAVAAVRGRSMLDAGREIYLGAPPFVGAWEFRWPPGAWWAVAAAVALVALWPVAAARWRWGAVQAGSAAVSLGWSIVLAAGSGTRRLADPFVTRFEYVPLAREVDDPGRFVRTFVDRLPDYPTHVKGHPPGAVLAYRVLDDLAGRSDLRLALLVLVLAATAAPASLVAVDRLAGRATARRAAVFAGLAPAVIWVASSSDALFVAVAGWALALVSVAVTADRRAPAVAAGVGAGLAVGLMATLTYGVVTLLAPVGAVALFGLLRRRVLPVVVATAAAAVLPIALVVMGFDWFDGFAATRAAYLDGVAPDRPFGYFLVANLAAFAVAIGPATVAGVAALRRRVLWWPVGGALVGAAVANLSGLSKGEVERIWLPLVPALVIAACSLPERWRRPALAAQLVTALALQAWLVSPW